MPDTLRMAGALIGGHTHREEDLLDGSLYARLAAAEAITGLWSFPAAGINVGQEVISSPSAGVLAVSGGLDVAAGLDVGSALNVSGSATVSGTLDVNGVAAIGGLASIDTTGRQALRVQHNTGNCSIWDHGVGGYIYTTFNTTTQGFAYAILGGIQHTGSAGGSYVRALQFEVAQYGAYLNWLDGAYINLATYAGAAGVNLSRALYIQPNFQALKPSTFQGIYIAGYTGMSTVHGVRVEDFTGSTVYLLEIGPATPYLRLVGGAAPGAGQTNLYLYEGTTPALRRVQWKAGNALGAADRVLVLA